MHVFLTQRHKGRHWTILEKTFRVLTYIAFITEWNFFELLRSWLLILWRRDSKTGGALACRQGPQTIRSLISLFCKTFWSELALRIPSIVHRDRNYSSLSTNQYGVIWGRKADQIPIFCFSSSMINFVAASCLKCEMWRISFSQFSQACYPEETASKVGPAPINEDDHDHHLHT